MKWSHKAKKKTVLVMLPKMERLGDKIVYYTTVTVAVAVQVPSSHNYGLVK